MIVMNLHGMLGNQLFQYAYAMQLASEYHEKIVINTQFLSENGNRIQEIGLQANYQQMEKNTAYYLCLLHAKTASHAGRWMNVFFQTQRKMKKLPERLPKHCYIDGYWQGLPYVEKVLDSLVGELRKKLPSMGSEACKELAAHMRAESNSVMLHIRRGDYLSSKGAQNLYCHIPMSYYKEAIHQLEKMIGRVSVYVFTNDRTWVKDNLCLETDTYIVDCDKHDYETLMLMSSCNHSIIANSTLSWWAAQINANGKKRVFAPIQWFVNEATNPHDLYPCEWIKI